MKMTCGHTSKEFTVTQLQLRLPMEEVTTRSTTDNSTTLPPSINTSQNQRRSYTLQQNRSVIVNPLQSASMMASRNSKARIKAAQQSGHSADSDYVSVNDSLSRRADEPIYHTLEPPILNRMGSSTEGRNKRRGGRNGKNNHRIYINSELEVVYPTQQQLQEESANQFGQSRGGRQFLDMLGDSEEMVDEDDELLADDDDIYDDEEIYDDARLFRSTCNTNYVPSPAPPGYPNHPFLHSERPTNLSLGPSPNNQGRGNSGRRPSQARPLASQQQQQNANNGYFI